jgi:glyoxylase-like metal-dependent hydrolase (beta-lactamase superfamily II)
MIEQVVVGALATNCWVYAPEGGHAAEGGGEGASPRPCAVIDPGADAEAIIACLDRLCLYPKYIFITHGHFDHIGALGPLAVRYPEALIAIHRTEASRIGQNAYKTHKADFDFMGIPTVEIAASMGIDLAPFRRVIPEAGMLLEDGVRAGPFTVVHLPGHSPGSVGFYNEDDGLIFSGDVLFQGDIGRTDLPGGDWNQMKGSLEKLFTLDIKTRVYPGHGPATILAEERGRFGFL